MSQAVEAIGIPVGPANRSADDSASVFPGLRATGVVVFASVDTPTYVEPRAGSPWEPELDVPFRPPRVTETVSHPLRRLASRGAAWLLGR